MAPATCSPESKPKPNDSRKWIGLGLEASSSVASTAVLGWWMSRHFHTQIFLVVLPLCGIVLTMWRLLRAATKP